MSALAVLPHEDIAAHPTAARSSAAAARSTNPAARSTASTQSPKLRLTRRGRIVFGGLITVLMSALLAAAALFGSSSANASIEDGAQDFGYVVVAPGATLWNVASELDPSEDPRDLVSEIVRLNQLDSSSVLAGQAIAVPLRYSDAPGVVDASDLGIEP